MTVPVVPFVVSTLIMGATASTNMMQRTSCRVEYLGLRSRVRLGKGDLTGASDTPLYQGLARRKFCPKG